MLDALHTATSFLSTALRLIWLTLISPLRFLHAVQRAAVALYWDTRMTLVHLLPVPDTRGVSAAIEPYLDLMDSIARREGWQEMDADTLSALADRQDFSAWWVQFHRERRLIDQQRAGLLTALYYIPESEWPPTAAEYATGTAVMMLLVLTARRAEQQEFDNGGLRINLEGM